MAKPFLVVRILCALSWGVYYIVLCLGGICRANAIPLRRFAFLFITMITRFIMNYAVSWCVDYYDECDKDGKTSYVIFPS